VNDLQIFNNAEFGEVRTVVIENEPWFVAKDVALALGYTNPRDAVINHVFDEDKGVEKLDTLGGAQNLTVINESGIYSLIFNSRLESAKKFKHWVTSEVLPSIRKTGSYQLPQTYQEALRALADKQDEIEKLAKENEDMLPKVKFYNTVVDSKTTISIGDTAKLLNAGMGQNKLFAFLRERNILKSDNTPYQRYIDSGYFKVVEQKYEVKGETRISFKTKVYQKGVEWIRRLLEKENLL
jgi:anti-repressor protein